jgi:hypothetical protein
VPNPQTQDPGSDPLDEAIAELNSGTVAQPPAPAAPPEPSYITAHDRQDRGALPSVILGAADSASFGFFDELAGYADTILPGGHGENVWNSNRTIGEIASDNTNRFRYMQGKAREEHKGLYISGQVAGGLAVPFGAGARTVGAFAKIGAIQGAIYGAGSGTDLASRAEDAVTGAAFGAAGGAIIGKVGQVAGGWFRTLTGRAARDAGEVAGEEAPAQVLGWGHDAETGEAIPILHQPEPVPPAGALPKAPHEEAIPLTSEEPNLKTGAPEEVSVGTIGRTELQTLQAQVKGFADRVASGETRAPDITASSPEAATAGEFRLGNLPTDASTLLGALTRQLPTTGAKTDAEVAAYALQAAKEIGEDPEAIMALGQSVAGKLGDADNAIAALRVVWGSAAGEVNNLHLANIDWATASDELVATAGEAIRNLSVLSSHVQQAKTGLGRGLRAIQLPDPESYLAQLTSKAGEEAAGPIAPALEPGELPTLPTTKEGIKDWFDLWGMTGGDPRKQAQFLQDALTVPTPGKYLRTSLANFFTASILSAPKTILMNLVGPGFLGTLNSLERISGAGLGALSPFTTMEQKAAMWAAAKETPKAYMQMLGDIGDTLKYAEKAFTTNRPVIGGGGLAQDALNTYGPLTDNLLSAANVAPDWRYTLGNYINVFPKAYARLNNGLDEAAKRLSANGAIRIRALTEASRAGLNAEETAAHVEESMRGSFDETGALRSKEILRAAENNTLTRRPGEEGSWVAKLSTGLQGIRRDIPEIRYILPVFNVAANGIGATLARLPGVGVFARGSLAFDRDIGALTGDLGPVAQAEAHGRMMSGAAFLTGGMLLNRAGLLTGAGPQNPTDRKVWLQTHQPYSIRVGDEWVRYDKIDVAGGLLSIPATIADATTNLPQDQSMEDLVWSGVGALAQWFKDRAALRTATSIFELGDNPTANAGQLVSRTAGGIAAGFIPAAVGRVVVDGTDPYQRMKGHWYDYLKAAIPGLSQTLEPVRNVLGEPMNRAANTFAEGFIPTTMAPATTFLQEPVLDEMDRLYRVTGYGAGADPKSLGYGFFDPRQVQLEDGQSLYDRAMQARQVMKVNGLTLKEALGELFKSDAYNDGVDADPGQQMTSLGDASRGYMVKQVFNQYEAAIKAELAASSPKASAYLTAAAAKQRDDAYLHTVSAEDLVRNPALYATHGIDQQAYSDKIELGATGALMDALQK